MSHLSDTHRHTGPITVTRHTDDQDSIASGVFSQVVKGGGGLTTPSNMYHYFCSQNKNSSAYYM